MAGLLGMPRERIPIAVAMVVALAATLFWLQRRFDQSDVRKGIAIALEYRPRGGQSIFDALVALGRGDPRCDGKVVSTLTLDMLGGRIQTIRSVVNPDKLRHVGPVADAWAIAREVKQARRLRD